MTDLITREIIQHALAAAGDEMAVALYRTAYSTIVRDCLDYSTSLTNAEGEMIAQGVTIPFHLGAVPSAMETLFAKFGDNINEGDIFILNDPFEGGMHIPDILSSSRFFGRASGSPLPSRRRTTSISADACRAAPPATIRKFFRMVFAFRG
jgi:N-methylhydantoinase B